LKFLNKTQIISESFTFKNNDFKLILGKFLKLKFCQRFYHYFCNLAGVSRIAFYANLILLSNRINFKTMNITLLKELKARVDALRGYL
jgi:hypothetical protein